MRQRNKQSRSSNSWDAVAEWYAGWAGGEGSRHHRRLAIPALMELLRPEPGEQILDVGCGPGALAASIARAGAAYTGVDASPRLLSIARRQHGRAGRFLQGDATRLSVLPQLCRGSFDGATFLLSIQDIDPLEQALASAAWALRPGGRLVLLMTHPCFRVPRQSGWGWDHGRRLHYRRVDRYLTRLAVPMKSYGDGSRAATRSYHRPLAAYINGLASCGLLVDCLLEIPPALDEDPRRPEQLVAREAAGQDNPDIPLFLALRAVKGSA